MIFVGRVIEVGLLQGAATGGAGVHGVHSRRQHNEDKQQDACASEHQVPHFLSPTSRSRCGSSYLEEPPNPSNEPGALNLTVSRKSRYAIPQKHPKMHRWRSKIHL